MSDAATSVNASAAAPSANAVARRRKHEMHFTASARREAKGAFYLGALSTGFTLVEAYAMRTAPELFGKAPMWALPVGLGVGAGLMASSYAVGQGEPYRGHVAAACASLLLRLWCCRRALLCSHEPRHSLDRPSLPPSVAASPS